MSLLPIFLALEGRSGLLVGAGSVALDKIGSLLKTGIRLRVVAPQAHEEIRRLAAEGRLEWTARAFEADDLKGSFLVIAATNSPAVNAEVYRQARARNILANSVDDIPNCDFFFGSVVSRGRLQVAISTSGESPALAQRLRREIDQQLPSDLGPWLTELGALRREVLATHPSGEARKLLLHELAQRQICASPLCATRRLAQSESAPARGTVFLVGAGPGDPDLLTVRAVHVLGEADVVLHDDLVPPPVLALARDGAEIVNVGKRCGSKSWTQEQIQALMIVHARAGRRVVRLKSGDPLVFGRAAEEISALREAEVPFAIVPGITAAFAAAAAVGCSLTSRNAASSVLFSTGHHAASHDNAAIPEMENATRVVYMPGRDLRLLALEWLEEGLPADFPCALISHAGQPAQQVRFTTLSQLGEQEPVPAPSLLLAGWVLRDAPANPGRSRPAHLGQDQINR